MLLAFLVSDSVSLFSGAFSHTFRVCECRASWYCDRAPRGWQLFQLFLYWTPLLILFLPFLTATGEIIAVNEGGLVHSISHLSPSGREVHKQEDLSAYYTTVDGPETSLSEKNTPLSREDVHRMALEDSRGDVAINFIPVDKIDSSAHVNLFPAFCILKGWSHMRRALFDTEFQLKSSREVVLEASPSSQHEQSAPPVLDWGSHGLASISFKFLTFLNRKSSTEVRISGMLTSNAQFCTDPFQETVILPGSNVSIPIAYIPDLVGKTEGYMLLQTSKGRYYVKTSGEGIAPPIEIKPFSSVMSVSKAEWQETVTLLNSFKEPVSVTEAYIWMKSKNGVSRSYQNKNDGILCQRVDNLSICSFSSWMKMRPVGTWFLSSVSSSPIMNLSIMVDDDEDLSGTLYIKIFRHSAQLSEVYGLTIEMDWHAGDTSTTKHFAQRSFLETEQKNEWIIHVDKSLRWKVQPRENFVSSQSIVLPMNTPLQSVKLEHDARRCISGRDFGRPNDYKALYTCRSCSGVKVFLPGKLMISINRTFYSVDLVLYSPAAFMFLASMDTNGIGDGKLLIMHSGHMEDRFRQIRLSMLDPICMANAIAFDYITEVSVYEAEYIHTTMSDSKCVRGNLMAIWSSSRSSMNISKESLVYFAMFSPRGSFDFSEQCHDLDLSGSVTMCLKSCGSHLVSDIGRLVYDGSVFMIPESSTPVISDVENDIDTPATCTLQQHRHCVRNPDTYPKCYNLFMKSEQFEYVNDDICPRVLDHEELGKHSSLFEGGKCVMVHNSALQKPLTICPLPVCQASLSKFQKLLIKLFFLILFSGIILLVKLVRQEKLIMTDVSLWHPCSHTFLLDSVCLKISNIRGSEMSENCNHDLENFKSAGNLEYQNNSCRGNRLIIMLVKIISSFGSIVRWLFVSQATILKVRVQITSSPCAASVHQNSDCSIATRKKCQEEDQGCGMLGNCVEKQVGCLASHAIPSKKHPGSGGSCTAQFQADIEPPQESTIQCAEDILKSSSPSNLIVHLEQIHHTKERKDKGKRRKKRGNVAGLKDNEATAQSGSSSPPSSPASPATPLGYGALTPFSRLESPSRSVKCQSSHGRRDTMFRGSFFRTASIQSTKEASSHLDLPGEHVPGEHVHSQAKQGLLHQSCNLNSQGNIESHCVRASVPALTDSHRREFSTNVGSMDISRSENWAAVARRGIAINDASQEHGSFKSSSGIKANAPIRPVLLPSATFPCSGRSMQWDRRLCYKGTLISTDPVVSPSLVSMSLVAPHARAPGSRLTSCNQGPLVKNCVEPTAQIGSVDIHSEVRVTKSSKNEYVYDIWGDHFAEVSRTAHSETLYKHGTPEIAVGETILAASSNVENLPVRSEHIKVATDVSVNPFISRSSAGFSIFSHNAFFSLYCREDDAGPSAQ
ncbi:hypothetical protein KP509_16G078300 [Ceratopteris richardii]|uniref:Transmembrane protein 131-like N-terminal domain-containing protein n=1 Tax=Ceratopteris richardii TaxID=49495 RepID=A0A8T2T0Z6_CERRI|nr:hypothetical protein KP509_16G078300 [Ceratopteris richardii]